MTCRTPALPATTKTRGANGKARGSDRGDARCIAAQGLRPAAGRRPGGRLRRRRSPPRWPAAPHSKSSSIASRSRPRSGAAHRLGGDRLSGRRRRGVRAGSSRSKADGPPTRLVFSERFECRTCGIPYEAAAASAVLVQQPLWRLSHVSRVRQRHRARPGSGRARFDEDDHQGAIEPWTKPHYRTCLSDLKRAAKPRGVRLDVPWVDLRRTSAVSSSTARAATKASAASSTGSSGRSTRCTSACS